MMNDVLSPQDTTTQQATSAETGVVAAETLLTITNFPGYALGTTAADLVMNPVSSVGEIPRRIYADTVGRLARNGLYLARSVRH